MRAPRAMRRGGYALAAGAFAAAVGSGLAACGGHFEVPVPVLAAAPAPPPPNETAVIALPISVSLARLRAELDSVFPPTDSLDRAKCASLGGLVCHQYLYRRDTLDLRAVNDRITLDTRLRYRAAVALPGGVGVASCGFPPEQMKRAELHLATSLYWRSDWRLASRGTSVTAKLADRCIVTVLQVDATPLMKRLLDGQTAQLQRQIDSLVPAVADLHVAADSLWRALQRPVPLDSASTVWLSMTPEAVGFTPISGSASTIGTSVVLRARPRVSLGEKPAATTVPLPTLALASRASGIHVPLEIELPFSELSQRATALLGGEVAGKGIAIGEVKIWGVGDTAVVMVGVKGKVNGSLYLLGRVAYDSVSRTVLLGDLRYTLASHDAMSRIKSTLGAGRIKSAIDEATGHGRLAVGEQLDSLKVRLGEQLNRALAPGVNIAGAVNDIRFVRLFTTQTAFVLRVVVDADATVIGHD